MTRFTEGVAAGVSSGEDLQQLQEQEIAYRKKLAVRIIYELPKDEFCKKLINGQSLTKSPAFGKMINFGVAELTFAERTGIRGDLNHIGIPLYLLRDDEVLDAIAQAIADRSVKVK